jgi:hypothetical protein
MEDSVKSRTELWQCMLEDSGIRCSVSTSDLSRDLIRVKDRVRHEGESFFTLTLPSFGKDFEQALRNEEIDDELFSGWRRQAPKGRVRKTPNFLGALLDRVFDSETGVILDEPCIDSVQAIRQLTLAFGKLKELCDPDKVGVAYGQYIETDQEIHEHLEKMWADPQTDVMQIVSNLRQVVRVVFGQVLTEMDLRIHNYDLVPKHGPGATADRKLGNQKYDQTEWPARMEQLFPFLEYAVPSRDLHFLEGVTFLGLSEERPVKLVAVPKNAKTPRLIAEEPTCMQYMQQAVSKELVRLLESDNLAGMENFSSFLVGFSEQWPNQAMAQIGSEDGSLATLDLSEASDRVPNWLVEEIFEDFPWFSEALQVTRSTHADVPGLGQIPLSKFASMGSAMTFPIEAMVFSAIAVKAVLHGSLADMTPVAPQEVSSLRDKVRVYGDDIIVPTDSAVAVIRSLEAIGFKVNRSKSFWTGKFRESCGKEFFAGEDVSIVRFRRDLPARRPPRDRDATDLISTVATRNLLYEAGWWGTVRVIDEELEVLLEGDFPFVAPDSPILGRRSFLYEYDTHKWDSATQSPRVRGFVQRSRIPRNEAREYAALLKCLLNSGDANSPSDHLLRSGRPRVVSIKRAMARPY